VLKAGWGVVSLGMMRVAEVRELQGKGIFVVKNKRVAFGWWVWGPGMLLQWGRPGRGC